MGEGHVWTLERLERFELHRVIMFNLVQGLKDMYHESEEDV